MLTETADGLYCQAGDFHIDPWGAVPRALITHAHGDHARAGSAAYLCAARARRCSGAVSAPDPPSRRAARPALQLGSPRSVFTRPGTSSARRRSASKGRRRLGRLRRLQARSRSDLPAVRADSLRHVRHRITFVLPIFRWDPTADVIADLLGWWDDNRARGPRSLALLLHARQSAAHARGARGRDRSPRARARRDDVDDRGLPRRRRPHARRRHRSSNVARGTVVRRRAGPGAALGARHAVDAAAGRLLRRVCLGPMRVRGVRRQRNCRSRLRPVRSRRLAGAASRRFARSAPHACSRPTVIRSRWRATWRAGDRQRRDPHGVGRRSRLTTRRHEASVRGTLRGARPDDLDQRQSRGDGALLRERAAGRCGVGGVFPDRPAAEASAALGARSANGRWRRPALEEWLLEECWAVVGDGAETATLILDQVPTSAGEPT